jgi:hypothetical protein
MREPLADAYMLVQDDALFFDQENVREYLEEMLWPGSHPGIVSLYCSMPDGRTHFGWWQATGQWKCGAVALIFPRAIAIELVLDREVAAHRWATDGQGVVSIPEVIEGWCRKRSVPLHYPIPSLVQHIGVTSTIWLGTYQLDAPRRANCFVGDILHRLSAGDDDALNSEIISSLQDPRMFHLDMAAAAFPEDRFPCMRSIAHEYESRVQRGYDRMQSNSVVICTLCRDVLHCLPATAARIERLGSMFREFQTVIFENDSRDSTLHWLNQWARANSKVHIVSEQLNDPKFGQEIGSARTSRMAYYRNRYREAVLTKFNDYDYVIVLDADLEGGWSYDGIAHTFGDVNWDFVGSYGIWYEPDSVSSKAKQVHYDAFAFRRPGCEGREDFPTVNNLVFHRGEPLVYVWSCFGGLGIYRMECFQASEYGANDCDHVTFHRTMRTRGFNRLFLNPSQIVLYTAFST